jgi:hypothetical protein
MQMHIEGLPGYLTVFADIDEQRDSVSIRVVSSIHQRKEVTLPTSYSLDYFQDNRTSISGEICTRIVQRYGLSWQPGRYA